MNKLLVFLAWSISCGSVYASASYGALAQDTNAVIALNKQAFESRERDPEETISEAQRALDMAGKLDYTRGAGESYRVMGIGYSYLNEAEKAIDNYMKALTAFSKINDLQSEAKVYNNIGNL